MRRAVEIHTRRGVIVILIFFLLLNAAATSVGLYSRIQAQHGENARLSAVTKVDCLEIEKLKTGFRADAIRQFDQLDQTLALLNLKKTPAIVRRATEERDNKLKTYAPEACPRPIGGNK